MSAASLNSGDCFVLASIGEYCIVWMGSGSSDAEKETAAAVGAFVNNMVRCSSPSDSSLAVVSVFACLCFPPSVTPV